MKRWPKNKSVYDTILVLLNFFYPWKSEWIDWMIHCLSKNILLKKKKKKKGRKQSRSGVKNTSTIRLSYKLKGPFVSLHYRNCHDRSMSRLCHSVAVMQSCPAFFFCTPVIFHEIRTLWITTPTLVNRGFLYCAELREKKGQLKKSVCPSSYYTERLFSLTVRSR